MALNTKPRLTTQVQGILAAILGGTGIDSSGSTGVAQVSAGTWSVSTTLQSAVQDNITRLGTIGVQVTISTNAGTLPAPIVSPGTILRLAAADGQATRLLVDAFGNDVGLNFRMANGTSAAPSGVLANDAIFNFSGSGYTSAGAYANAKVQMLGRAAENWTGVANGTYLSLSTTPIGSTTRTEVARWDDRGNALLGTTTAPTTGTAAGVFGLGTAPASLGSNTAAVYAGDDGSGNVRMYGINEDGVAGPLGLVYTKSTTGDPTGREGLFVINTFDNTFKVYADAGWRTLASGW